jgi:thiol-disulfide isomerase/thioredoxin
MSQLEHWFGLAFCCKLWTGALSGLRAVCCCLAILAMASTGSLKAQSQEPAVELRGIRGELIAWPPEKAKPRVLAFIGTGCPLVKLYADRLQQLSTKYGEQVEFLAIAPHPQDSLEELAAFARQHQLEIPVAKDVGQHLARRFGITRTPEVVLIDEAGVPRYQGRIDDQYGVGFQRKAPEREDLKLALESVLGQRPVDVGRTEPAGCLVNYRRTSADSGAVTYASHVARILNEHCVRCHREGQIGPFAMSDYQEVSGWAEMIAEVVREKRMPPWHADPKFGKWANDCSLSNEDRDLLLEWVANGAPAGDLTTLPPAPKFVAGWQLPQTPDMVLSITDRPVKVRSTGDVKYQYFVVDPKLTEEKWVRAAELRPGNLRVVHHILCFLRPRGSEGLGGNGEGLDGFLCGYVPGMLPLELPPGMAKRIPKDSELVFQVHYTPIGSPQEDLSQLGLVFATADEVTHEVVTTSAVNPRIEIPPGKRGHEETAWNRQQLGEWPIISLMPHLHLRGQAFRYEAVYADGRRETLLDVPGYDFNWQTSYQAAEPLKLPKGTRIFCTATYDNSPGNLNNPDPTTRVSWGDQTWEEMMIGYFDVAIPLADTRARRELGPASSPEDAFLDQAERLLQRWDKNGNERVELAEVPQRWRDAVQAALPEGEISLTAAELAKLLAQLRR